MTLSADFTRLLTATGYFTSGVPADGMIVRGLVARAPTQSRYDFMFDRKRFPLKVDALFRCRGTPIVMFIDAMNENPSDAEIAAWHRLAWNFGLAPLLWVATRSRVLLLNSYGAPRQRLDSVTIAEFSTDDARLSDRLTTVCGRLSFDTGAFWRSTYARNLDRKNRVDAVLLRELAGLEHRLRSSGLTPLLAQKLIGRTIFSQYLADRQMLGADRLRELFGYEALPPILRDPNAASVLFAWMKSTFNGDLFPPDVPGEHRLITSEHLSILADFLEGQEASGQLRMFPFRFDVIPVELISSIYEQFAHSVAGGEAAAQGLHYTPTNLVDLMLDLMFDDVPGAGRVLDPACGSGVFLVEAFRRLVWRRSQTEPCSRELVRDVLYNQLFGVDINPGALQVTAFSLYLAALELDPDLSGDPEWLKFDHLIGRTLHLGSFFGADVFREERFDAIIGNPPWTYTPRGQSDEVDCLPAIAQPRRTPDWAFVWQARDFAKEGARVAFLMKATPFFSKDRIAGEARRLLLTSFRDVTLINMAQLRHEGLFPAVVSYADDKASRKPTTGPALLFSARIGSAADEDVVTVVNVPWQESFKQHGVFELAPEMFRQVAAGRIRSNAVLFKAAMYGNEREFSVMESLLRAPLVRLGAWCALHGIPMEQGLQLKGGGQSDATELIGLEYIDAANYQPIRLRGGAERFVSNVAHRPRDRSIYRAPLVLCPEAGFAKALQRGRYSSAVSSKDVAFTDSFVGISFADKDPRLAPVLSAILNSKTVAFQLAFGGSNLGLKQPKVEKVDLEEMLIPDLFNVQPAILEKMVQLEQQLASQSSLSTTLNRLDDLVAELYGLNSADKRVIDGVLTRSRAMFMDTREARRETVAPATPDQFAEYGFELAHWLDTLLNEETPYRVVLNRAIRLAPDVVALRFDLDTGPIKPTGPFITRQPELFESKLVAELGGDTLPKFHNVRFMRAYTDFSFYLIKPDESRYWQVSDAQSDVALIVADQRFRQLAKLKVGWASTFAPRRSFLSTVH